MNHSNDVLAPEDQGILGELGLYRSAYSVAHAYRNADRRDAAAMTARAYDRLRRPVPLSWTVPR